MHELWTSILTRLQTIFDPETLGELVVEWFGYLVVGLIIILVFYLIWRVICLFLRPSLVRSGVDETTTSFVETAVKYTILIIGIVTALDSVDIQTSAVLASSDGKMLAVPNTEVINKTVASYTNFPHLRLDIPVTVGVNENLADVRRILLDLVTDHPDFLADPPPASSSRHLMITTWRWNCKHG